MEPELINGIHKKKDKYSFARYAAVGLIIIGLSLLGIGSYKAWQKSRIIIPDAVKKQVSFAIFWPQQSAPVTTDKTTIKYDHTNKLLSYVTHTKDGANLIISQQPTPETFTDIPQVYTKLVEGMQQYSTFGSISGTVYLTHPKELKGGQTAVMNSKGTLMFIKPDKDVTEDTWRQLFNNFQLIP